MNGKAKSKLILRPKFLSDLQSVCDADAARDFSADKLAELGRKLELWRACEKEKLKAKLRQLPKDHPLRCPTGLFGPMEMGRLEVMHTRTLRWLLDPKASHGFRDTLVNALLSAVRNHQILDGYEIACVDAEWFYRDSQNDDSGRMDIRIEAGPKKGSPAKRRLIVIEAKVDSSESDHQLDRYNREISQSGTPWDRVERIFLTTDRRDATTGRNEWNSLSFSELAKAFWETRARLRRELGFEYLRLYIAGVLADIQRLPLVSHAQSENPFPLLRFFMGRQSVKPKEDTAVLNNNKSLGFYLTHWYAMQELYEEKNVPRSLAACSREVNQVGDRAREQVVPLLIKCGEEVTDHFKRINGSDATLRTRLKSVKKYWTIEMRLRPKHGRRANAVLWEAGTSIDAPPDGEPELYAWLWAARSEKTGA